MIYSLLQPTLQCNLLKKSSHLLRKQSDTNNGKFQCFWTVVYELVGYINNLGTPLGSLGHSICEDWNELYT